MSCLAFFWILKSQLVHNPTEGSYDSSHHLSLEDTAVDSRNSPHVLQLLPKQSKTDPFKQHAKVYLGATGSSYIPGKKGTANPLFITKEGKGWTAAIFRAALKSLLAKLKVITYNTHS